MPTIKAWQHIYSNVEEEQSPQGRGGFQTLFYTTSGLTEAEVEEMESRLLYFPSQVEPVKRLFFTTSTGKGVVAQIVSLSDPDQFGRKGRYLAHSLIFAPERLAQFEADPFCVFRRFTFFATVAEALARGNFKTGDIPAASLELPSTATDEVEAAGRWPTLELKKLALLTLRVDQQAQAREAITLAGEAAQIESALEAAFLVAPTAMRPRCAFDSYFYHCNLVATYFWAIGLPEPPVSIKFAQVDGAARRVQGEVTTTPKSAYEHWVIAAIDANRLAKIARDRNQAFALAEWLDGRAYDLSLLEAASPELIKQVLKVNPGPVQALLGRRVGEQLPSALANRVAEHIYRQTTEATLYRQLRQGFEVAPLLEILYKTYAAQQFEEPPRAELKALKSILEEVDHKLLRLFLAYWASPRRQLPKALKRSNEAEYRQFGEIALRLKLVKPFKLLLPGRGEAFIDLYLASSDLDDLLELTEALIDAGETTCLSRLTGYVSSLPGKELRKLGKLIDKQSGIPKSFQAAVEQALAALPPQKGVKGMLRAVWRRLPGRE